MTRQTVNATSMKGLSWEDVLETSEDINAQLYTPQRYAVGTVFACPDYDVRTRFAYFYCIVTAFCEQSGTGVVTFMRPCKLGFALFPSRCVQETAPFDGARNALVPCPFMARVNDRCVRPIVALTSHVRLFLDAKLLL